MDDERWIEQLREKFGITYLRPFQELIIKHIFENDFYNKDSRMLACLPTGSGKNLGFEKDNNNNLPSYCTYE